MHQGNGQLLFILVVSYSFDFRMDRSNKDIVSVKHSFALYVDNTPLSVFSSLFSLYQSKVTYIASYCTVQALSSDFTECVLTDPSFHCWQMWVELPLHLLKYFIVLSCPFPVEGKTRTLCRASKLTVLQIWSTGSWVLSPSSVLKIFWDSTCVFPKEGVKITASMRQFGLLRASQIQWAGVITCHITWGHQMSPGTQALPVHRARERLLLPCSIQ